MVAEAWLRRPVAPKDRWLSVARQRLRIEDEIVHVVGYPTLPRGRAFVALPNPLVIKVDRGQEGTTAAPHPAGANVEYLPPLPEWLTEE